MGELSAGWLSSPHCVLLTRLLGEPVCLAWILWVGNSMAPHPSSSFMVKILVFHYPCPFPLICLWAILGSVTSSIFVSILNNVFCKLSSTSSLKLTRGTGSLLYSYQATRSGSLPSIFASRFLVPSWLLSTWEHSPLTTKLILQASPSPLFGNPQCLPCVSSEASGTESILLQACISYSCVWSWIHIWERGDSQSQTLYYWFSR